MIKSVRKLYALKDRTYEKGLYTYRHISRHYLHPHWNAYQIDAAYWSNYKTYVLVWKKTSIPAPAHNYAKAHCGSYFPEQMKCYMNESDMV